MFYDAGLHLDKSRMDYSNNLVNIYPYSGHITLKSYYTSEPSVHETASINHNASLFGTVSVGQNSRVDAFANLNAVENYIEIGDNSYIGKYTTLNIRTDLEDNISYSVAVGNECVVGDKCYLSNCIIGDNVWIGDKVVIQEGTVIQDNVVILDNTNIGPNQILESGNVYGGQHIYDKVRNISEDDKNNFANLKAALKNDVEALNKEQRVHQFTDLS